MLNTSRNVSDPWLNPSWSDYPAFDFCHSDVLQQIAHYTDWPAVSDYGTIFPAAPIAFTPQDNELIKSCGGYERFIDQHQAIPTRAHNIHDFMNALTWQHFPNSKLSLHRIQIQEYEEQVLSSHNKRSARQNACTLFDECGVIFVSENKGLVQAIREHQWQTLFYNKRTQLINESRIYVFGHALLEKSLKPYIGMCGNAIPLDCSMHTSAAEIDALLAQALPSHLQSTAQMLAFPILGYPGWHPENASPDFYQNFDYFRPLPTQ